METEPIVRATSLAAHGSDAPVAAGPEETANTAPGSAAATTPASSLRRLVALPVVMKLVFTKEVPPLVTGPVGHPTSCHPRRDPGQPV
ncbi:hypothetical protein BN971_04384 [Mycobacterium bohemicum DSM 44277]|uniref:Uncharacterized protein n=1 Tax=Mycobacterium bohemicum DSM 44277 TaxID=1236609 RepID=A0A0U0WE64_MYCBE|nr:hypothetical protein [Mycobacterium bohemicum]CPR13077.1 hypothetical protein BN971_04384 [Mycobacterium bohemicum DSM 44277]